MGKRVAWSKMQKLYVGRKYRGKLRSKNKRITFTVVDVTLGGDVMIRRRGYSDTVTPGEV